MKKSLLFLSIFLCFQSYISIAQTLDLPAKLYLCDNGTTNIDGTVTNTADTGITYQWYYSTSSNVQVIIANEIAGATSPMYSAATTNLGNGYYKVVASMTDTSTLTDEVRVFGKVNVSTYEFIQCMDYYTIMELVDTYYLLDNTLNVTYTYHYTLNDANSGINNIGDWDGVSYMYQLYLRIEENNGMCIDVITVDVFEMNPVPWANWVPNMGSCSPDSTTNVFDLTTNDTQIIGGQPQMVVNYFTAYNDAWNLLNPIANPASYTALSPNQTIYARVLDINNPNNFCDPSMSITQFQLLSAPDPTPNTIVSYVVCDNSSGTSNDGVGLFDLPSRNPLVLSGLSTNQFTLSYYTTLADAQNDVSPIANPETFASSNIIVYSRVESNVYAQCIDISVLALQVQNTCDDISVSLVSYWGAPRPGFTYRNKLVIKNNGPATVSSGSVEFVKDALLTYNNATGVTAGNTLTTTATGFTLDFVNLASGAQEEVLIDMTVPANATLGDMLTNTATYTTSAADVYPENNVSILSEIIIGSYDPNDIIESRGPEIVHSTFTNDDYLYYTVRFQNVGTASAINITIDNGLDVKLDKTTFEMLHSSHTNTVERVFDQLTWQFDNINLADSTNDEPNSHGYVHYKIKPLVGYSVGDIVPNTASIVFDFNTPVITNTFDSEFIAPLGLEDYETLKNYSVYPNPTSGMLFMNSKTKISEIEVYNYLGQVVMKSSNKDTIDMSRLDTGLYFIKIKDVNGDRGIEKVLKK